MWRSNLGRAARDRLALEQDKQWNKLYHLILKMDTPLPAEQLPLTGDTLSKLLQVHQNIREVLEQTILPPIHDSLKLTNEFGRDRIIKVIVDADRQLKEISPLLGASVRFLEFQTKKEGRSRSMYTRLYEGR